MKVRIYFFFVLLFCVNSLVLSAPTDNTVRATCGYDSCPAYNPDTLNVHLVAHSHDDVGWLKSVDEYYYGSHNDIQKAGVQYIISSVIEALQKNPARRFIQVETAFFYKWWLDQDDTTRDVVKNLVANGQLEFTGGAWSMNDEAASYYHSVIDQFTFGLGVLDELFGTCARPRIGWQIDPFGHSKEMASIFAGMSYDAMMFSRLDYRDKDERLATKTAELLWQSSESLGDASNLFTVALYNHYSAPSTFCFDVLCNDSPLIDDENSVLYNLEERVKEFNNFITNQAKNYATNNIIITMGDDFQYQDAEHNFVNLDRLIAGFEKFPQTADGKEVKLFYSTPACYLKAVNEAAKLDSTSFAIKTDDFFPYASSVHSYWTGYFTSRPTSKRFERQAHNLLQIIKQLATVNIASTYNKDAVFKLEDAVGIMQHHDAITGTEKKAVASDYARIVDAAITEATVEIDNLIAGAIGTDGSLNLHSCLLTNVTICDPSVNKNEFVVAVYNPLSRKVSPYVKLPVKLGAFSVLTENDVTVPSQVSPVLDTFDEHLGSTNRGTHELTFEATDVPALGYKLFFVKRTGDMSEIMPNDIKTLGNDIVGLTIDDGGAVQSIKINSVDAPLTQKIMYYIGFSDDQLFEDDDRKSGAYIFRPKEQTPVDLKITAHKVYSGEVFDEVHQHYEENAKQIIRVYKNSHHIDFDWLIGPIDNTTGAKEYITRFTASEIDSGNMFYTDANGREMIQRQKGYRATYPFTDELEPVAANYYPVTSKIAIRKDNVELALLTDRAQGGASLNSGELELMLHRKLLKDDGFGVSEVLTEDDFFLGMVARGSIALTLTGDKFAGFEYAKRLEQERGGMAAWTFVADSDITEDEFKAMPNSMTALVDDANVPENVQILTYQPHPTNENHIIVRLEHMYELSDNSPLAANAAVNLENLFANLKITSVEETTLDGHQLLQNEFKFDWIKGEPLSPEAVIKNDIATPPRTTKLSAPYTVDLVPRQIRTFLINTGDDGGDDGGSGSTNPKSALIVLLTAVLINLIRL